MKIYKEESGAYGNAGEGDMYSGQSFPAKKKNGVVGEDAPVNSISGGEKGGQIAGAGIQNPTKGSTFAEPGVGKTKYKDTRSPLLWPEMMRRTMPNMVKEEKKKVKIKLNPEKEVGYTVHSVGPGRKLTLTKSGTMKAGDIKESATLAALAAGSALGAAASPHINKAVGKGLDWLEKKRKKKHQDHYEKKSRKELKEETFAGSVVFEVSAHTFHNAKMEKRKGKHWRTYLDECDELSEIREYANKNPKKAIVLQNRNTNEMVYVRYGKAR